MPTPHEPKIYVYTQPIDRERQIHREFTEALAEIVEALTALCQDPTVQIQNRDFTGTYYHLLKERRIPLNVIVVEDPSHLHPNPTEHAIAQLPNNQILLLILTDIFGGITTPYRKWLPRLEKLGSSGHVFTLIGLGKLAETIREKIRPILMHP